MFTGWINVLRQFPLVHIGVFGERKLLYKFGTMQAIKYLVSGDFLAPPQNVRRLHPHVLNVLGMQMRSHLHMQSSHVPKPHG